MIMLLMTIFYLFEKKLCFKISILKGIEVVFIRSKHSSKISLYIYSSIVLPQKSISAIAL